VRVCVGVRGMMPRAMHLDVLRAHAAAVAH
jgi:hypothetical protein